MIISLLIIVWCTDVFPKSFRIDQIHIQAKILRDGSLQINETRYYQFKGRFRWADYRLPLHKLGKVSNFKLSEAGIFFRHQPGENPGTYPIIQNEHEFYVKCYYQAHNQSRAFTLQYRVSAAVTVYNDLAEFYYQFVGGKRVKEIGVVNVCLELPEKATPGQVQAWAHGSIRGQF